MVDNNNVNHIGPRTPALWTDEEQAQEVAVEIVQTKGGKLQIHVEHGNDSMDTTTYSPNDSFCHNIVHKKNRRKIIWISLVFMTILIIIIATSAMSQKDKSSTSSAASIQEEPTTTTKNGNSSTISTTTQQEHESYKDIVDPTTTNTAINGNTNNNPDSTPFAGSCGCSDCTANIWNLMAGDYTCGERIQYLVSDRSIQFPTEQDACRQIAFEFPCQCGSCDPARCGIHPREFHVPNNWIIPPTNMKNIPQSTLRQEPDIATTSSLYCYPPESDRVRYTIWDGMTVEVKEGNVCGPGNNHFSRNSVQVNNGNDLSLLYANGQASEVRVILPNSQLFTYGTYSFHIKSVKVMNGDDGTILSTALPKELVLGLFTWDDTEDYATHENYNHEVDIEISRWNCESNSDVQFLVQPPGYPQMNRFFSGKTPKTLDQGGHLYEFTWNPGHIDWFSTSGSVMGGYTFHLKTEEALFRGVPDYVQCMPSGNTEVRMNLWNMLGAIQPAGLSARDKVEVVIDNFSYTPSSLTAVPNGDFCSKHCQCKIGSSCVSGICNSN
eukprot:scaffold243381_cov56-Attheya_sp.AAC.2